MVLANGGSDSSPDKDQAAATDTSTSKDPLGDAISAALDGGTERASEAKPAADETRTDSTAPKADSEQAGKTDTTKQASDPDKAVPAKDNADTEAPQHWPADRRQTFAKLPPEARGIVQGFVKDLTGGYTRKMQEIGDDVRYAKSVKGLFNDRHRQQMQAEGVDELGALKNLIEIHNFASQHPVDYAKWVMQRFGITADQLSPKQATQEKPADSKPDPLAELLADPEVKTLKTELAELKKWRDERVISEQQYQRAQVDARNRAYQTTIEGFRSQIDDNGQLAYPHFDRLRGVMGSLMQSHPVVATMQDGPEKLAMAYQMAVRADPELSESVIESDVARRMAAAEKKQEAEKAKRAGGIRPASGAPTARPAKATSLDSALNQTFSQLGF